MKPQSEIQIFKTSAELAKAAGRLIIDAAKNAINMRDRFVIALSGGHTPGQLYTHLSKPPFRDQIPWDKTFVFWGDERCVPQDDEQSNAHMARTLLLDHIDIPTTNINTVPADLPPIKAAIEYEHTIKKFFGEAPPRFDLIILGLGENGHTASLFPQSDAVYENTSLVREVYVAEQKMFRITMTANLINQARNIVFLIEGENKAEILKTVLTAPYQPDKYPAQLIKPENGNLYWYTDNKAAMLLRACREIN